MTQSTAVKGATNEIRVSDYGMIRNLKMCLSGKTNYTLVSHKIAAQNRYAASIAASKALYSYFLNIT